ncbi:MAG: hypothetical protein D6806_08515, partial [Deltaproteobacteria bacterium]
MAIPAFAQQNEFQQGVEAYENFEYQKALKLFQLALKKAESTGLKARIYVYMGVVRYTIGDKSGAQNDFEKALKL